MKQRHLLPVLENLSIEVYGEINVNTVPPSNQDTSGSLNCPECRSSMERHGYMGSNQLLIDSCPECTMIWLDKDELATMVGMYVRFDKNMTNMRLAHRPSDIVGVHMTVQVVTMAFLTGFVLG